MSRPLRIILYIVGGVVCTVIALIALGIWSVTRERFEATKNDLPSYVTGRWDWSTRARPCGDSAHTISFTSDQRVMQIVQENEKGSGGAADPTIYDVTSVTSSRIRGAIRGETRRTVDGVPVVWELVMFTVNEYRWQRTDWNSLGYTPAIIRCETPGTTPR